MKGRLNRSRVMKSENYIYKFLKIILKPLVKIFFPYEVRNAKKLDNLPKKLIICSNHLSNLDAVFLICVFARQIYFMAKSELFKNFFMRKLLLSIGTISVERGKNGAKAIEMCKNRLLNNQTVMIFIEGTRSKTGEFLRPRTGAIRLANMSESAVLPICITGGGKNNKVKIFRKTIISIGDVLPFESIKFTENSYDEIKNFTDVIGNSIKTLRK